MWSLCRALWSSGELIPCAGLLRALGERGASSVQVFARQHLPGEQKAAALKGGAGEPFEGSFFTESCIIGTICCFAPCSRSALARHLAAAAKRVMHLASAQLPAMPRLPVRVPAALLIFG